MYNIGIGEIIIDNTNMNLVHGMEISKSKLLPNRFVLLGIRRNN